METNKAKVQVEDVVEVDINEMINGYMEMAAISLSISSEGFCAENEAEATTNNFLY